MPDYKAMYQRVLKANKKAYREISKLADVLLELMQAQYDAEQLKMADNQATGRNRK